METWPGLYPGVLLFHPQTHFGAVTCSPSATPSLLANLSCIRAAPDQIFLLASQGQMCDCIVPAGQELVHVLFRLSASFLLWWLWEAAEAVTTLSLG